jgi:AcrR family transcriptional regulator
LSLSHKLGMFVWGWRKDWSLTFKNAVMQTMNRRQNIIRTASSLMRRTGYDGTSIEEIAKKVGIHKSTFFHYFANKEELLLEILKIGIAETVKHLEEIVQDRDLSPKEKLRQAIINDVRSLTKYKNSVTVFFNDISFLSPAKKREYLKIRDRVATLFEKIIIEMKESNPECFKDMDAKIVAFAILGMCNWLIKWYKKNGPLGYLEIADTFYRLIMTSCDR